MTINNQTKFMQTELGEIPEDWEVFKLDDLGTFRGGVTSIKRDDYGFGTPYITYKNIFNNSRIKTDQLELMNVPEKDINKFDCKYGDIFFTASSETYNEVAMSSVLLDEVDKLTFNGFSKRLRLNDFSKLLPEYARYVLRSRTFRDQVEEKVTGDVRFNASQEMLGSVKISLPPLPEQQKIAEVLGALDEKIELNRKMNKTLDSLAQAIFKKWFSNAESDSIVELGKKITIRKGKNITKDTVRLGSVPVVAGGLNPSCYHDTANTVSPVVTVSASGANAGFIRLYHDDVWASDCSYIDKSVTPNVYFYYLYLLNNSESVTGLQRGSAQPHVYPKDLMELMIPDYDENLISEFEKIVEPIFRLISINSKQIESLSQIRDSLLPRLMSGKLRAI